MGEPRLIRSMEGKGLENTFDSYTGGEATSSATGVDLNAGVESYLFSVYPVVDVLVKVDSKPFIPVKAGVVWNMPVKGSTLTIKSATTDGKVYWQAYQYGK